jgi:predicted metalloprotease
MKLEGERDSGHVEDRRGRGMGVGGGIGLGTVAIALIAWFLGIDPTVVLEGAQQVQQARTAPRTESDPNAPKDEARLFVGRVLASTEDAWEDIFRRTGNTYRKPTLVLFDGQTGTACGVGQAATGPFYCPGDEKLYIDLAFFRQLKERFRAPGDFAQAYVIAHEVGHHVQKLTGVMGRVDQMRTRSGGGAEFNRTMVRLELQADCYAGIWARYARDFRGIVEEGDVEEALNAAAAIGDDRLQQQSRGRVVPDSFTHGTSAQRVRWFQRGLASGSPSACDTFAPRGDL